MSQAQSDAPATTIDRASAYYPYMLAHMYAAKATKSPNPEDADRAIENYKAAIKADPEAATISEELAEFERTGRKPVQVSGVPDANELEVRPTTIPDYQEPGALLQAVEC